MVRILNIVTDEKFIDDVIECHDIFSEKVIHDYVIVGEKQESYKYIKKFPDRVKIVSSSSFLPYLKSNGFDAIFLHSFFVLDSNLIVEIPKQIKVFWFAWGYDIYSHIPDPFIKVDLYGVETKRIKKMLEPNDFKSKLRSFLKTVFCYDQIKSHVYYKAISRIDYFSGVLDFEYSLMENVRNFRAKKVTYTYNSISVMDSVNRECLCNGNNILIGNSADDTNNHLDVLKYIKNIDLGNSLIYIPLSYAGGQIYIDYVKNVYKSDFGDKFVPIDHFIPYQEYTQIMASCSVAIFAHERQQAIGNICAAFRKGCKVFLSETSNVYKYYKSLGMTVFSLQREFSSDALKTKLTDEQVIENIRILDRRACRETYIKDMNHILECIKI